MFGAIIGDVSGSRFEFNNINSKEFVLFGDINSSSPSFFTDDTVLTCAIAEIILSDDFTYKNIVEIIKKWSKRYPEAGYGNMFKKWIHTYYPKPYNSFGNGAAMRISPIALFYNDWDEIEEKTIKVTEVTHNHPEGIKGALSISRCIYLAKNNYSKEDIKKDIENKYKYDLDFTIEGRKKTYYFNETCQKSVPESIVCFLESESIEDIARNAMYLGGDCDTTSAIACSIGEAFYGRNEILEKQLIDVYLTKDIVDTINKFYIKIKK